MLGLKLLLRLSCLNGLAMPLQGINFHACETHCVASETNVQVSSNVHSAIPTFPFFSKCVVLT